MIKTNFRFKTWIINIIVHYIEIIIKVNNII